MNEKPIYDEAQFVDEDNIVSLEDFRKAIPKTAPKEPSEGDWLSGMICGTEFKCRDKTGRTPRWLVQEFTQMGKLKGDVLLSPTVTIQDPKGWFWVEPVEFCRQWEFRGIIEEPKEE